MTRPLNSAVANLAYRAIQTARREPVFKALEELEISQGWPVERLLTWQWGRLKALIEHAYTVPFYKARFQAAGLTPAQVHAPADFARLPLLTKTDLRRHAAGLRAPVSEPVSVVATSGSSGTPLSIWRSRVSSAYTRAAMFRAHRWHGLEIGDRELRLWGEPVYWKGRWMEKFKDRLMNRYRMSVFDLPAEWVRTFYQEIRRRRPRYLFGYASLIDRFARLAEAEKLDFKPLNLRAVKTTSEPLRPEQAQRLEGVLGCSVLNEYGCTEAGILAATCPAGGMHLSPETTYVELVPLEGSDWFRVVVTDLHNKAMPLLRYEVGDLARPGAAEKCPCGLGLPLLGEIAGRKTELIEVPGGKTVHSLVLYYVLCGMEERGVPVREARLIQKSPEEFVCQIVPEERTRGAEDFIRRGLSEYLGSQVRIEVESVDSLSRMPSGKNADFVKAF